MDGSRCYSFARQAILTINHYFCTYASLDSVAIESPKCQNAGSSRRLTVKLVPAVSKRLPELLTTGAIMCLVPGTDSTRYRYCSTWYQVHCPVYSGYRDAIRIWRAKLRCPTDIQFSSLRPFLFSVLSHEMIRHTFDVLFHLLSISHQTSNCENIK